MSTNNPFRNFKTRIHNSVVVSGNLGNDPFRLNLKDGSTIARVLLAQHEYRNGEKLLYWFHIILNDELAEQALEVLRKGQRAGFSGKLVSRQYYTETNKMITIMEVEAHEFWLETKLSKLAS